MSNIPRKHQKNSRKKLFLFDPITAERKPVDYDILDGLVTIPSNQLSVYICKRKPLYQLGAFLINEDFTGKDLVELMTKWRGEEVKNEIWKSLPGERTQVSSLGRFRNKKKDGSYRLILPGAKTGGHVYAKIWIDGKYDYRNAQRIVAEYFVERDSEDKNCVWHKNGLQFDNRANNLVWMTKSEVCRQVAISKENIVFKIDIETGEVLDEYTNPSEAARENFMERKAICYAAEGRNKNNISCGFIWKYAKDC
jgi:hypothetical protein